MAVSFKQIKPYRNMGGGMISLRPIRPIQPIKMRGGATYFPRPNKPNKIKLYR